VRSSAASLYRLQFACMNGMAMGNKIRGEIGVPLCSQSCLFTLIIASLRATIAGEMKCGLACRRAAS